jgi:hypothetical protein
MTMDEYINRSKFVDELWSKYCKSCISRRSAECRFCWVEKTIDAISQAPAERVVKVVTRKIEDQEGWKRSFLRTFLAGKDE